jgi:hypothetical protein
LLGFTLKTGPIVSVLNPTHFLPTQIPFDAFCTKCIWTLFGCATQKIATLGTPTAKFVFALLVFVPIAFKVEILASFAYWHSKSWMTNEKTLKKKEK